ncbi:hypothetical protein [Desulfatitalea alkaliphila]|uniref:Cell division protein FtsL n=1 Tax=Desulfatitalea alkaliphila TaxID=2929485 RepID=A0AA41URT6_9BACT|nr:hypothetical protein [Desulfatitalea alkaliphila]MCJ8502618.1 hypothetical protein [Desulfatitalea alkaliphila]
MAPKRKQNSWFRGWSAVMGLALLGLLIVELLFYTWCRVQLVQAGYGIARESRKQQELQVLHNSLKVELARLKAPEHLSRIARDRFSLVVPDARQIVVVP